MPDYPSYWLKLVRAKQHLDEIERILEPFSHTRPYTIRKTVEINNQEQNWVYTAHVDEPLDPLLPVIIGDFLFNVRSALDHIAVALAPGRRKRKASFPIIIENIEKADLNDREQKALARWTRATQQMPSDAVAFIKSHQPYDAAIAGDGDARDHVLAILSDFQNADKHRELTVVGIGLDPERYTIDWRDGRRTIRAAHKLPDGKMPANGAVVERLPIEVDVQLEGTAPVMIGRRREGPQRPFPHFGQLLFDFATKEVVAPLDHLLLDRS